MPEQTNADVVSGFIGLTVVFARRNAMIPARAMVTAATTRDLQIGPPVLVSFHDARRGRGGP